jgi:hypothetical protein
MENKKKLMQAAAAALLLASQFPVDGVAADISGKTVTFLAGGGCGGGTGSGGGCGAAPAPTYGNNAPRTYTANDNLRTNDQRSNANTWSTTNTQGNTNGNSSTWGTTTENHDNNGNARVRTNGNAGNANNTYNQR